MMVFETSKQHFVNFFWFQEKQIPESCTVEFIETKQVTVVQW